ncbi:hypothetical protein H6G96_27375 [Nostoc sp. FACHB-892]|uniref:hypothetical protein n=1 Tax=Nostoc sp. FACHB-892 TaxID=2692843 RepID=UPI00168388C4|nr:hypothetical protein [Nostoc sp. FACHB-892]MBD2729940.1 hypothetical protein [Nostoc sp. FACHB-892]
MATINISDLRPTGSELFSDFSDSEGYMDDLVDSEIGAIQGGSLARVAVSVSISVSVFITTFFVGEGEAN